ncbi:hypothetical protein BWD42_07000 [Sphingobacterium sp. CZ-UAM]|uniref:DUF4099 domain-containing protein n=1 Tax=Sphingobacterium sp. CZ-UAM TaxID=1933868 RepID=UPI0009842750|nr:DUF4099 domain-containing protein [Sphingobacterium sp. CZ-UAM]OOG19653.1 hypothetical protein BWD42_07000 [Sphingobacterium sp. CZ-UAM]
MDNKFLESDIPIEQLRKLGLITAGKPDLSKEDIQALISGHRTDLITLRNLNGDGIHIQEMQAKLSLQRDENGHMSIQIHPIYRDAKRHALLLDIEAEQLELGQLVNVMKTYQTPQGKKSWIIEYDPETKEFISSDPDKVEVPEKINHEALSEIQKHQYRHGDVVTLSDGTLLQRRAASRTGVTANRTALIYSLLLDGGTPYLLLKVVDNLMNSRKEQEDPYTAGYRQALNDMESQNKKDMKTEPHRDGEDDHVKIRKLNTENWKAPKR